MNDPFLEQRNNFEFYVKLGKLSLEMQSGAFNMMPKAKQPKSGRHRFNMKDNVQLEFISQGQTINQTSYVEISKRLRGTVRRKRPELWPDDWILHNDNAPAHKALSCQAVYGSYIDY
jgi:hypothetical protein